MVVTHVAVESSSVSDKHFVLILRDPSLEGCFLEGQEIFFLEVSLEDQEQSWRLVRNLMENHLGTSPRGFL